MKNSKVKTHKDSKNHQSTTAIKMGIKLSKTYKVREAHHP